MTVEVECTPEDVSEFILVFMDEVFDSVPDTRDRSCLEAASYIAKLCDGICAKDYQLYDEISTRFKNGQVAKIEFHGSIEKDPEDMQSSDDEDMDGKMQSEAERFEEEKEAKRLHEELLLEEAEKKAKKKAKKRGQDMMDDQESVDDDIDKLRAMYQPKDQDDGDDGWTDV